MKVLLLVHGLGLGGAETIVCALARHLRAAGAAVEIGCLGELGELGDELRGEDFRVVRHQRRPGFDWTLALRLALRLRRGRFDVVHAHQRTAVSYGLLAGLLDATPLVYTEHGPPFRAPSRRKKAFNRLLRGRVRHITAVADSVKRALVEVEGFVADRITVVPNGVDIGRFHDRSPPARAQARARDGLPLDVPIVGTVGRLAPEKNQGLLLHVLAQLRKRLPNTVLVVVGDGTSRSALGRLAQELGVADGVRVFGPRRDIDRILAGFDVFCLSSISEGVPLTLLEAMAARVPVVATSAGGIAEAARPDREAILIPGAPPDCRECLTAAGERYVTRFADAVAGVLLDPLASQSMTDRAHDRVTHTFALDDICERYRQILKAVARTH